jgi:hypothetical protein
MPAIRDDEPAHGRVPTKPIVPLEAVSVTWEMTDPRSGKKIRVTIECVD